MRFTDIPGLDEIKSTLKKAVDQNHVAHAQLFIGNKGGAQLGMALSFISYLFCQHKENRDACGNCSSCTKVKKGIHPDLFFVFPVKGSDKKGEGSPCENLLPEWREFIQDSPYRSLNAWLKKIDGKNEGNIPVEEMRSLSQRLHYSPFEAAFKVALIWNPESMNQNSGNAILKIIEEPPKNTLFILVGTDPDKLLTTILSRCQTINIPNLIQEDLKSLIQIKTDIDEGTAQRIVSEVEGDIELAFNKAENEDFEIQTWFVNWMRAIYSRDILKITEYSENFDAMDRRAQKSIFDYGLFIFRQCLYAISGADSIIRIQDKELNFIKNFSKILNQKRIDVISQEITKSYYHIERNARSKMVLLDLSLKLVKVFSS